MQRPIQAIYKKAPECPLQHPPRFPRSISLLSFCLRYIRVHYELTSRPVPTRYRHRPPSHSTRGSGSFDSSGNTSGPVDSPCKFNTGVIFICDSYTEAFCKEGALVKLRQDIFENGDHFKKGDIVRITGHLPQQHSPTHVRSPSLSR